MENPIKQHVHIHPPTHPSTYTYLHRIISVNGIDLDPCHCCFVIIYFSPRPRLSSRFLLAPILSIPILCLFLLFINKGIILTRFVIPIIINRQTGTAAAVVVVLSLTAHWRYQFQVDSTRLLSSTSTSTTTTEYHPNSGVFQWGRQWGKNNSSSEWAGRLDTLYIISSTLRCSRQLAPQCWLVSEVNDLFGSLFAQLDTQRVIAIIN